MNHLIPINFDQQVQQFVRSTRLILEQNRDIKPFFEKLHPAIAASVLQLLSSYEREEIIKVFGKEFNPEIFNFLDENIVEKILNLWTLQELSTIISQLDENDAIKILENFEPIERNKILSYLDLESKISLESNFSYQEDSAGRIMDNNFISINEDWKVGYVRNFLIHAEHLPEEANEIYVIDKQKHIIGKFYPYNLLRANDDELISSVCTKVDVKLYATDKIEDVIFAFKTYLVQSLPVFSKAGHLVGIIKLADMIDHIYTNVEEEVFRSGALYESDFYDSWISTSVSRLKWLTLSLVGAFCVSILITKFNSLICKKVVLASLLPVINTITAIAAIQSTTVNIRALMDRELNQINLKQTIFKELFVGLLNACILGIIVGTVFGIWHLSFQLALVIVFSLLFSLLLGAFFSTIVPIVLHNLKIDPTLASGAFLNTLMDAISTLLFFYIAKYFFF